MVEKIKTVKNIIKDGILTPANVSKLSDGASFLYGTLTSEKYINKKNITPQAKIFGYNLYIDKPINTPISFINCIKNICQKYNISRKY